MFNTLSNALKKCDVILIFAGAGMSADSGLPTYRDTEGFWNDYPLYRDLDRDYVSMMSPQGFHSDPHFAWGFFIHQYMLYTKAYPHDGYRKLLDICRSLDDFFIVTTNVDGLFLKAGFPKSKLHEAHGTIHRLQCCIPCSQEIWESKGLDVEIDHHTMRAKDPLPSCPVCGALSRPNIFMYGDNTESYLYAPAEISAKKFRAFREKYINRRVLILDIGVGAEGMKAHITAYKQLFADVIHCCINPHIPDMTDHDLHIAKSAKDALMEVSL